MLTRRNQNDVQIEVKKGAGKRTTTPQKVFKLVKWAWIITSISCILQETFTSTGGGFGKGIVGAGVFAVFFGALYCGFIWLYRKFQAGKQTYYDAVNFKDLD